MERSSLQGAMPEGASTWTRPSRELRAACWQPPPAPPSRRRDPSFLRSFQACALYLASNATRSRCRLLRREQLSLCELSCSRARWSGVAEHAKRATISGCPNGGRADVWIFWRLIHGSRQTEGRAPGRGASTRSRRVDGATSDRSEERQRPQERHLRCLPPRRRERRAALASGRGGVPRAPRCYSQHGLAGGRPSLSLLRAPTRAPSAPPPRPPHRLQSGVWDDQRNEIVLSWSRDARNTVLKR